MICEICGTENKSNAVTCEKCGVILSKELFFKECEPVILESSKDKKITKKSRKGLFLGVISFALVLCLFVLYFVYRIYLSRLFFNEPEEKSLPESEYSSNKYESLGISQHLFLLSDNKFKIVISYDADNDGKISSDEEDITEGSYELNNSDIIFKIGEEELSGYYDFEKSIIQIVYDSENIIEYTQVN